MSSLKDKLLAARAMQAELVSASNNAASELGVAPTVTRVVEDLPQGPAQIGNNQSSPMAKLRAKMQAAKEGMASPVTTQIAGQSVKDAVAPKLSLADKLAINTRAATLPKPAPALPKPVEDWHKPVVDSGKVIIPGVPVTGAPARTIAPAVGSTPKLTLAQKLAAKHSLRPALEAAANEPAPEPEPPEPTPTKPMSAVERLKARKLQAKDQKATDHPSTADPLQKQLDSFMNQPDHQAIHTSMDRPTSSANARVEVVQTPIVGAPQVKAMEEQGKAQNRQAVKLNLKQLETVERFVVQEKSCVMIGPAGTGKTTGVRGVLEALVAQDKLSYTSDFKRQNGGGLGNRIKEQPNVAIVAFTKRAVTNIMESVTSQAGLEQFKYCCQTIHNLLEYAPEYYDVYDDETGDFKQKMRFTPHKHAGNMLDIDWLIVEEASMTGLDLWSQVIEALPSTCKILFLGDINQLAPVFGLPILAYAMYRLPVVALTEVYRQSVGPVLRNAHNILQGAPVVEESTEDGQAFICYEEYTNDKGGHGLKKHNDNKGNPIMLSEHKLSRIYTTLFSKLFEAGRYDPDQDMIISPFNVGDLGTLHMNQCLAQFIGDARNAVVYEILAGFHKVYLALGDKVMIDKQDGIVTAIHHNTDYMGSLPKPAGADLSRFGVRIIGKGGAEEIDLDEEDVNFDLDKIGEKTAEELKRAASHIVEITLESGEEIVMSNSGQFSPDKFTLGYCITGHKAQGSEWRNVYVLMHKKHHSLLTREWLYTVVTRAKQQCTLMCKPFSVEKALASQRITGDTVEEKLAWFTSGAIDNLDEIQVTP
jgi:hypothetical protein